MKGAESRGAIALHPLAALAPPHARSLTSHAPTAAPRPRAFSHTLLLLSPSSAPAPEAMGQFQSCSIFGNGSLGGAHAPPPSGVAVPRAPRKVVEVRHVARGSTFHLKCPRCKPWRQPPALCAQVTIPPGLQMGGQFQVNLGQGIPQTTAIVPPGTHAPR